MTIQNRWCEISFHEPDNIQQMQEDIVRYHPKQIILFQRSLSSHIQDLMLHTFSFLQIGRGKHFWCVLNQDNQQHLENISALGQEILVRFDHRGKMACRALNFDFNSIVDVPHEPLLHSIIAFYNESDSLPAVSTESDIYEDLDEINRGLNRCSEMLRKSEEDERKARELAKQKEELRRWGCDPKWIEEITMNKVDRFWKLRKDWVNKPHSSSCASKDDMDDVFMKIRQRAEIKRTATERIVYPFLRSRNLFHHIQTEPQYEKIERIKRAKIYKENIESIICGIIIGSISVFCFSSIGIALAIALLFGSVTKLLFHKINQN